MSKRLLAVTSKLGKIVSLNTKRWEHVLSHPEMCRQRLKIKDCLVNPDEIRESERSSKIWLFYKLYQKTPVTTKYVLVVVRIMNGEGFIVTAFFTDKIKKGELIWRKSQ